MTTFLFSPSSERATHFEWLTVILLILQSRQLNTKSPWRITVDHPRGARLALGSSFTVSQAGVNLLYSLAAESINDHLLCDLLKHIESEIFF